MSTGSLLDLSRIVSVRLFSKPWASSERVFPRVRYTTTLLPLMTSGAGGGGESAESSQEHAMLRRRTVWLLGKWCGAGALPTAARPSLYGALVALLREDSLALALTVSRHDISHLDCILLKRQRSRC